jgi:hypothetical protein
MVKVMPREIEQQLVGLSRAVTHAEKLFQRGVITHDELEHVRTFALEQRFGPLMDAETYVAARKSGDFEAYEALMNDPRSGTAAQRESAARKVAAHFVATNHLETPYQTYEDQEAGAKRAHKQVSEFIDTTGFGDDPDAALMEAHVRLNLGDKVSKPVEEPSWSKPLQKLTDDDPHVRDFKLRDENMPGTRRHQDAHDSYGEKRDAKGRYIPKNVLREDADKIPTRKNSTFEEDVKRAKSNYDDTLGYQVDKEYGVRTAEEARSIEAYEQGQRDDAARAQAAAEPAPAPAEQPVILPSPSEA